MASRNTPPFRADHVGSLRRPRELMEARERLLGPHDLEGVHRTSCHVAAFRFARRRRARSRTDYTSAVRAAGSLLVE